MSAPILTIGVACYNVEAYVERAIASYADERFCGRLEVVLVDDGSQDATASMLDEAAHAWPSIFTVIHKENGGHGSAVNAAMDAAQGQYFRVVDGDDWVDTEELVSLFEILENETADLVVDQKTEVDMATMALTPYPLPEELSCGELLPFEQLMDQPTLWPYVMIHTLTMRTALLREAGIRLLEHTFYVDLELVVKASLAAQTVRFERLSVYQYLVGNASQSVADAGYVKHFDDHTRVCKELLSLLDNDALETTRRSYLIGRCALAVNTHYNIALIFDDERSRGRTRAREFKAWLTATYPEVAPLTNRRYYLDLILHFVGVRSQDSLNRLSSISQLNKKRV